MIAVADYASVVGLDVPTQIRELSFPVRREKLLSEGTLTDSHKDMVFRDSDNFEIGTVPHKRPPQNHGDTMAWIVKNFDEMGVPYKLKTSILNEDTLDLYQEWVFDRAIVSPDGEKMVAMIITRSSFVRNPLSFKAGTFRFVCQNGSLVGNITGDVVIRPNNLTEFVKLTVAGELAKVLQGFNRVEQFYTQLAATSIKKDHGQVLNTIFGNRYLNIKAKRAVLGELEAKGTVTILSADPTETTGLAPGVKKEAFLNLKDNVNFNDGADSDLWETYNHFTNWATFMPKNESLRMSQYTAIDSAFLSAIR